MTALTGEEKAGLLLLSLRPHVASAVLTQLGPQAKARLAGQMQRLATSPHRNELIDQILQEAEGVLRNLTSTLGPDGKFGALSKPGTMDRLVGDDAAQPPAGLRIAQVGPYAAEAQNENDTLSTLNRVAQDRLLLALDSESPRTIALILNCLAEERAGAVFKELPSVVRREVSIQLSTSAMPNAEIVDRTVRAILSKEQALPRTAGEAKGDSRFKKTAQLLRKLERNDRADALTALQERDANVAAQVREFLYQFEDILLLDGRSLQKVLGELDSKMLALAMKGASEAIVNKINDNISKRAREGLAEEMEYLGSPAPDQLKQARRMVVEVIQKLDQAGEITMLT